ncbi:MAG: hypothetical protein GX362_02565 [Methanosarcinaceae archaeon]|nr:hypothetical protein [Methanosarcinaceae archaeon]
MIELKNQNVKNIKSIKNINESMIEPLIIKEENHEDEMSLFFEELIKRAKFYGNI